MAEFQTFNQIVTSRLLVKGLDRYLFIKSIKIGKLCVWSIFFVWWVTVEKRHWEKTFLNKINRYFNTNGWEWEVDALQLVWEFPDVRPSNILFDCKLTLPLCVKMVQARMIGLNEDGVPMIHLYRSVNGQTVMVNRELVDRSVV